MITESQIESAKPQLDALRAALGQVLFGQEQLLELTLAGLLAQGHLLLEGLPGLGKTELVKGLAAATGLDHRRVQFTPDLLPGDLTGTALFNDDPHAASPYRFHPGPLFAQILLADEINRASPKTQSALLEAMQEHQVTVLGETHPLPRPFFVLATQNPIDLEGTYPLPEAQLDRFLFKLVVHRSSAETLKRIVLERSDKPSPQLTAVTDAAGLEQLIALAAQVHLPEVVADWIARLVDATHRGQSQAAEAIDFGASPRAALGLARAVRARALLAGRIHASFEDVEALAPAVLRHRLILSYQARLDGQTPDQVTQALLKEVPAQAHELPKNLTATAPR